MIDQDEQFFPPAPGTYILLLHLTLSTTLAIGRMGAFEMPAGWYAYAGSALGSGGLRGRLRHHLASVGHPHWHVDYLRRAAEVREVWFTASAVPMEHAWAAALSHLAGAALPVPRFGASDCRCPAHLVHFERRPSFTTFQEAASVRLPAGCALKRERSMRCV